MDRSDRLDSLFTKEQREAAEARLKRLDRPLSIDLRGTARFSSGRLWLTDQGLKLLEVDVAETGGWQGRITVMSREPLEACREATIAIDRADAPAERLNGRLDASRPGRRAGDPPPDGPRYYASFMPAGAGQGFEFR